MSNLKENELKADKLTKVNGGTDNNDDLANKTKGDPVGRMLEEKDIGQYFYINGIDGFEGIFKLKGFKGNYCVFEYTLNDQPNLNGIDIYIGNVVGDIYYIK